MLHADWQSFWEKYRERTSLLIAIAKKVYENVGHIGVVKGRNALSLCSSTSVGDEENPTD